MQIKFQVPHDHPHGNKRPADSQKYKPVAMELLETDVNLKSQPYPCCIIMSELTKREQSKNQPVLGDKGKEKEEYMFHSMVGDSRQVSARTATSFHFLSLITSLTQPSALRGCATSLLEGKKRINVY